LSSSAAIVAVGPRLAEDATAGFLDRVDQAARQVVVVVRRIALGELLVNDVDG
jgi:hypothetical protein